MVRKLEENPGEAVTVTDGIAAEVSRTTMPTLSRLIRGAAVQAEEEWAARHANAL